MSQRQHELLMDFERIILFLDGDEAGQNATKEIAARLMYGNFVRAVSLVQDIQPDALSSEEIAKILSPIVLGMGMPDGDGARDQGDSGVGQEEQPINAATDEQYRAAAKREYEREGEIEIDEDAVVSRGDELGAYVEAWVWVNNEELE